MSVHDSLYHLARRTLVLLALLGASACGETPDGRETPTTPPATEALVSRTASRSFDVRGTATHYFTTAALHSEEATADGKVQRSTDIIRLEGDLDGYVLYHPTSVFDFAEGSLVNTGTQVFSGTVKGSRPVILKDDRFRFEVDLASGATSGQVYLSRSLDAPHRATWFECQLEVVGTGFTAAGDGLADYSGHCREYGNPSTHGS
ncbi:MAG: hypothetical protein P8188_17640 [Gemmatimonadota bacterium]